MTDIQVNQVQRWGGRDSARFYVKVDNAPEGIVNVRIKAMNGGLTANYTTFIRHTTRPYVLVDVPSMLGFNHGDTVAVKVSPVKQEALADWFYTDEDKPFKDVRA